MDRQYLFKIFGIKINLHWSWFLIVVLLAYSLATGFFPVQFPELSRTANWTISIISALLLFASVLFHELAHSLVARKFGIGVEKITLFFFGGVAQIPSERMKPKTEALMAAAGPVFSICLGLFFWLLLVLIPNIYISAVSSYLFRINFILAAFNLVPGFPLDGGRILRALLWSYFGDIKRATRYAANAGKGFAIFLMAIGFFGLIFNFGFLWFMFIGFFLYTISKMSYEQTIIQDALEKVSVKEAMTKANVVGPELPVKNLIQLFLSERQPAFLVVKNKKLLGYVSLEELKGLTETILKKAKVKSLVKPIGYVKPEDSAYKVLARMVQLDLEIIPVIKNKKLVGIIKREDLLSLVRLKLRLSP